jgi:hypothetical protein
MKHLKKFNETNQDNYWSLMKLKKYYFMSYRPNQGMACKPDATNLYTIVLRIYPNGLELIE